MRKSLYGASVLAIMVGLHPALAQRMKPPVNPWDGVNKAYADGLIANLSTLQLGNVAAPTPTTAAPACYTTAQFGASTCVGHAQEHGIDINTAYFGAKNTGTSHPLSSITSAYLGGSTTPTSTVGWTLAQWQVYYPTATSLNNEIDGLAISAAFNFIRQSAKLVNGGGLMAMRLTCPAGLALSDTSIDAGRINGWGITADFAGCPIDSTAAGEIAFDALHSQRIRINNLSLIIDPVLTPSWGFVAGRIGIAGSNDQASDNLFDNFYVYGPAPYGDVFLNSTESSELHNAFVNNNVAAGCSNAMPGAALVLDGVAHFINSATNPSIYNPPSNQVSAPDLPGSFAGASVTHASMRSTGCGPAIWSSLFFGFHYDGYLLQNGTGLYAWTMYLVPGGSPKDIVVATPSHSEGGPNAGLKSEFNFTGTDPAPALRGFRFGDEGNQSQTSIFHIDTTSNIGLATISDVHLNIQGMLNNNVALTDQGSMWSMQGDVTLDSVNNWLAGFPAQNKVNLCSLSQENPWQPPECWNYVPRESLTINPKLDLDQPAWHTVVGPNTANGTFATDGWQVYQTGSASAGINVRNTASGAYQGQPFQELFTTLTASTLAANQVYALRTPIEGNLTDMWNWGTANALPITVDILAISSIANAQAAVVVSNQNGTISDVIPIQLPATANTWQKYSLLVPGPTTGSWASFQGLDNIGALISVVYVAGTNYQAPAPNVWTVGPNGVGSAYYGVSTMTPFSATAGATLGFVVKGVYATPNDMPAKDKSPTTAIAEAQRWYQTSCPFYTQCQSNANGLPTQGAVTMIAPPGFSSGMVASTPVTFMTRMYENNDGTLPPTITFASVKDTTLTCFDQTQNADGGVAVMVNPGPNGFLAECPWVTGELPGDTLMVHYRATAKY